jgi:hypothetical protein
MPVPGWRSGCHTLGMTGWRQGVWLPIYLLGGAFANTGRGSWRAVAAVLVGAVVGALWQVVARRDPTDRLTWLAAGTLVFGFGLMLDPLVSGNHDPVDAGWVVYFASVASAVVITEQVLRRRELGRVTLDMVHAPDVSADDRSSAPDAGRRTEA